MSYPCMKTSICMIFYTISRKEVILKPLSLAYRLKSCMYLAKIARTPYFWWEWWTEKSKQRKKYWYKYIHFYFTFKCKIKRVQVASFVMDRMRWCLPLNISWIFSVNWMRYSHKSSPRYSVLYFVFKTFIEKIKRFLWLV